MTCFPVAANGFCWWLTTQPAWRRLHAVPREALDPADEDAVEALCGELGEGDGWPVYRAVCGLAEPMAMPGMISRLAMERCGHCCKALGISRGRGTPANAERRARKTRPVEDVMAVSL